MMPPVAARIRVHLTPRAGRDELAGWRGEALLARVSEPPVDGRANAALQRLVAAALGLPKSAVHVVAGGRGREKTIAIDGLSQAEAIRRLQQAAPP